MEILEERVIDLEQSLSELIEIHKETEYRLQRLEREMREFKDEMREFKDEMKEFKDEMREAEKRAEKERREMNRKWGQLANKLGTVVEDIIFPATRPVIKKYFKCDPSFIATRIQRKEENLQDEFDVIAVCKDKVFLIEVKTTLRPQYINDFKEKIERFKVLFPEYQDKELIPIFASLAIDENFVNMLTKSGFYAMAYREWDYMDILNFEEVKKRRAK